MSSDIQLSDEEITALDAARELIKAGIPLFSCPPNPQFPGKFYLPKEWEKTTPDLGQIERWQPGWGLALVCGHGLDVLDFDPRAEGFREAFEELVSAGHLPRQYGRQETPSGGWHLLIHSTGERKATGFMPGIDLQSGDAAGVGRGFAWLAPTVGASKAVVNRGTLVPYRWVDEPNLEFWEEYRGSDDTTEHIVARVHAARVGQASARSQVVDNPFAMASELRSRTFTPGEAETFCRPYLEELQNAKPGVIEERCNAAAVQLSHFVPNVWSADFTFAVLEQALGHTVYDGGSGWTVEKFRAVLDGRRPPLDNWKAELRTPSDQGSVHPPDTSVQSEQTKLEWLREHAVTAEQLAELPAPEPLVYGLLNMNTLSWLIGAPGSFKSFVALDLAGHVGRGMEWRGHRVRQGKVIVLAAEGAPGMTLRARAWMLQHGQMDNVLFLPLPIQAKRTEDWGALVDFCREQEPALVIIDTQHRVTRGLNENDSDEMGIYISAVEAIQRATGACVLTVHHTGRNGGDARGSSAIDGAQDTELKLTRATPRSSMIVKLNEDKQKDMAEDERGLEFKLKVVDLGKDPATELLLSSLVLEPWTPFATAEGSSVVREPEDWERNWPKVQGQILRVMMDQGGVNGLTESVVKRIVAERWYGGKCGKASDGHLRHSTWGTAWSRVREYQSASGDPVLVNIGGERWTIDSLAFQDTKPPEGFISGS